MLKISPGTLQNLRVNGTLRFTKIGGIIYYSYEDIELLLEGTNKASSPLERDGVRSKQAPSPLVLAQKSLPFGEVRRGL